MYFAIDFDGTIACNAYPAIGDEVPHAVEWLATLQMQGALLVLWTVRDGKELQSASDWCLAHGIVFHGVNRNPDGTSRSPKVYAHAYVDDAAVGCPLVSNPAGGKPYADWNIIGPTLMRLLDS